MRIANVLYKNEKVIGIIKNAKFYPFSLYGINEKNVNDLIDHYTLEELIKATSKEVTSNVDLSEIKLLAPIEDVAGDVLCLGLNYKKHIEESMRFKKEEFKENGCPVYFAKRVGEPKGDNDQISLHDNITNQVDYESELAFIIEHDIKNIENDENAYNHIFGYTIINDVSARELQTSHKQWYYGKSLDGFCPMGPVIVTRDELDPRALSVKSYVNNSLRQNGNTKDFIFNIPFILNDLTKGMTIKAKTIISTGTPEGVGMGMTPPTFLKKGDTVTCEIEGIGKLTNFFK